MKMKSNMDHEMTSQNNYDIEENNQITKADFETAIGFTGYGKYNIGIFIATMLGIMACQFDCTSISYILSSAECDLGLTENEKGWINASIYFGMVISSIFWSILADTLRRRKVIIIGFFIDGVINLISIFSPNFYTLFFFKFLNGVINCGPNAVMLTYVAENHAANVRARVMIFSGICYSICNCIIPVFALLIIPEESFNFFLWGFEIRSWRIFMAITGSFSLLASIAFYPFYESPKYLMTSGKNEEALEIFQHVYRINSGKPIDTYPVKTLHDELATQIEPHHHHLNFLERLQIGWHQIILLFSGNFLQLTVLNFILQFAGMFSLNTLRLWIPQLFATVEEFYELIDDTHLDDTAYTICEMIDHLNLKKQNQTSILIEEPLPECGFGALSMNTYINSLIIGVIGIIGYLIAGYIVNKIGKKNILIITFGLASVCSLSLYWTTDALINIVLLGIFISTLGINATSMVSIIVDLYPTTMRAMAVTLILMSGRVGSIIGNILFPIMVNLGGCISPFFTVSSLTGVATLLSFGVPRTLGRALK